MEKRVSDSVVDTLSTLGITDCFSVVGGGAMHLNNAFHIHPGIKVTYMHHEQACAFAAEGYAKLSGNPAAVCVTSGPGSVNALNGVYSAYVDSTPMIVIAGYPRSDTTVQASGLSLRCRGVQEFDIVSAIQGMTKYAKLVSDPESACSEVAKAYQVAMEGRRGPVWLSIPLDIQSTFCSPIIPTDENLYRKNIMPNSRETLVRLMEKIRSASRPCILTGAGIRYADAHELFLRFLEKVRIPVVGGALLADTLPEGYPLFYGLSGNVGPRAGNYILDRSDCILVLGNSMSAKQIGFNSALFARNASIIMVDVEEDEIRKPELHVEMRVVSDLKDFFSSVLQAANPSIDAPPAWVDECKRIYSALENTDLPMPANKNRMPAKFFWHRFREKLPSKTVVALGNSPGGVGLMQYGTKDITQRVLVNYNAGSMGDDLPLAIGAAVSGANSVICATGDGSIMMNLQELQTIIYHNLPIKIIVFSNNGYGAIRQTCKNYFNGTYAGCDEKSGISFPSFERLSQAFGYRYIRCDDPKKIDERIQEFIQAGPMTIMEVFQDTDDSVIPKVMSKQDKDGQFITPGLTEMSPILPQSVIRSLEA